MKNYFISVFQTLNISEFFLFKGYFVVYNFYTCLYFNCLQLLTKGY